jgi:hypothetical protein
MKRDRLVFPNSGYPVADYRRLTYMTIVADVAAVSPSSVFRVLRDAGRRRRTAGTGTFVLDLKKSPYDRYAQLKVQ